MPFVVGIAALAVLLSIAVHDVSDAGDVAELRLLVQHLPVEAVEEGVCLKVTVGLGAKPFNRVLFEHPVGHVFGRRGRRVRVILNAGPLQGRGGDAFAKHLLCFASKGHPSCHQLVHHDAG